MDKNETHGLLLSTLEYLILFVTGSRKIDEPELLFKAFEMSGFSGLPIKKIIHGGAKDGVDKSTDKLIEKLGTDFETFRPEIPKNSPYWQVAKLLLERNSVMAEKCHICLALWDRKSTGTKDAFEKVKKLKKPYIIFVVTEDGDDVEIYESNFYGLFGDEERETETQRSLF